MKHPRTCASIIETCSTPRQLSSVCMHLLPINFQCVQIIASKTSACPASFLRLLPHAGGRVLADLGGLIQHIDKQIHQDMRSEVVEDSFTSAHAM